MICNADTEVSRKLFLSVLESDFSLIVTLLDVLSLLSHGADFPTLTRAHI